MVLAVLDLVGGFAGVVARIALSRLADVVARVGGLGGVIALLVRGVRHGLAVLVAVAVQLPLILWWGLPIAFGSIRNDLPLKFALGWLFDAVVILVAMPLCTLAGGLLGASRQPVINVD